LIGDHTVDIQTQILALSAAVAELSRQIGVDSDIPLADTTQHLETHQPSVTGLSVDFLPGPVVSFVADSFAAQWCAERGFESSFIVSNRPVVSVVSFCELLAPLFSTGAAGAWSSLRSAIRQSNTYSYIESLGVETTDNYLQTDSGRVFIQKNNLGVETPFAFADSLDKLLDRALSSRERVHRAFGLLSLALVTEQQLLAEPCSESVFLELRAELSLDRWAGRFGELAERASVEPSVVFDISNNIRPSKSVARRLGRAFGWRRERTVCPAVSDTLALQQSIGLLLESPDKTTH
jgi:hypothetical protein